MDPDFVKNKVKKQQEAYEFVQKMARDNSINGDGKNYLFEVTLWRKRSGIESTIRIEVLACNGMFAKKWAEESMIGWKSISYTCMKEIV